MNREFRGRNHLTSRYRTPDFYTKFINVTGSNWSSPAFKFDMFLSESVYIDPSTFLRISPGYIELQKKQKDLEVFIEGMHAIMPWR